MNVNAHRSLLFSLLFLPFSFYNLAADADTTENEVRGISGKQNTLSTQEKADGWTLLFDGKTLEGWHVFQYPNATPAWSVAEGILFVDLKTSDVQHGDLATDQEFENFELSLEWKTPENGNSGVFINVQEDAEHTIAWQTGPEYQMLGAAHPDNNDSAKRSGDIFGYTSTLATPHVKKNGEWNHSIIKQVDGKVEFYLNGALTSKVDFNSPGWKNWLSQSRFKDIPDFSAETTGHIVLQEWSSPIFFRNIKIREL